MIARLGARMARWAERFVHEPIILAAGLSLVAFAVGCLVAGPAVAGDGWLSGFSKPSLLAFALRTCLVLVTGHALAVTRPAKRLIGRLARIPKGPATTAGLVGAVAVMGLFVFATLLLV